MLGISANSLILLAQAGDSANLALSPVNGNTGGGDF